MRGFFIDCRQMSLSAKAYSDVSVKNIPRKKR